MLQTNLYAYVWLHTALTNYSLNKKIIGNTHQNSFLIIEIVVLLGLVNVGVGDLVLTVWHNNLNPIFCHMQNFHASY